MSQPISEKQRQAMRSYFASAAKPKAEWRVGIERECIALLKRDLASLPFTGDISTTTILQELGDKFGWQQTLDKQGSFLRLDRQDETITLEPASQIELSSRPSRQVADLHRDVERFESELLALEVSNHLYFLFAGMDPKHAPQDKHWIPKSRYALMRNYYKNTGKLGTHMMSLTSAIQVSLDFSDEKNCAELVRTASGLAPIFTAIYANSPISNGKKTGYVSYRSHIWSDTDPSRCGVPPFVFADRSFFDAYIDYALDVPMLFSMPSNEGSLEPVDYPTSFRQWIGKKPEAYSFDAWLLHLSTIFTEVRLKNLIEIRIPDANFLPIATSFAALCKGLFFDAAATDAAWSLVSKLTYEERQEALKSAAALGMSAAKIGRYKTLELAQELYQIAETSLKKLDQEENTADSSYLQPAGEQIFGKKRSPGEEILDMWDSKLKQDPRALVEYLVDSHAQTSHATI